MRNGRKHARASRRRRWLRLGVFTLAFLVALGGGGAFAAYRYEESQATRLLPGVRIAGVDVGDLTRTEALRAVSAVADEELSREIEVTARGETWHLTPQELGTRADVEEKVAAAFRVGQEMPWHQRVVHRVFDRPVEESLELEYTRDGEGIDRFLKVARKAVRVRPRDAAIELQGGELVLKKPKRGVRLDAESAAAELERAALGEVATVELPVETVKPKVAVDDLGHTIVVRLSENRLYLYDGLERQKVYRVATARAGHSTPQGTWNIWDKRENPTWINPAPNGWGKDMPLRIGPGPGNPLGTHALYLDAPGIRIHGTYAEGSIGTYASAGCIRMTLAESRELYSIVPVGTKVHVLW